MPGVDGLALKADAKEAFLAQWGALGPEWGINRTMAEIHAHGKPWLLLEHVWPGGWQLWRCVVPPANMPPIQRYIDS